MNPDFSGHEVRLSDPATRIMSVTPSDSSDLPYRVRALHCAGTQGTVRVTTVDDDEDVLFLTLGGVVPVQVRRVHATGTTATGIKGLS